MSNYTDLVVYCPSPAALVAELAVKLPHRLSMDPDLGPQYLIDKTPTIRNQAGETLALLRLDGDEWKEMQDAQLETLQILGTYEQVFADPDKMAIYNRVYPTAPQTFTDEEGTWTYQPPLKFGVFS